MMRGHVVFVPLQLSTDQMVDAHLTACVNDPSVPIAHTDMRDFAFGIGKKGDVILNYMLQGHFFSAFELF